MRGPSKILAVTRIRVTHPAGTLADMAATDLLHLARTDGELQQTYNALLARMRADREAMAGVEDNERARRGGIVETWYWLVDGAQVGPMSDGPATAERVREELQVARQAARGAVAGRYDARAWRARGVVEILEYALGIRDQLQTACAGGQLAA